MFLQAAGRSPITPTLVADATVAILGQVPASGTLTNAIFKAHIDTSSRRLCVAVEWHAVAMVNAPAVTQQQ
ncbi:MAG: hypothetical protein ACJ79W_16205 [Myxococcales bacterium]